MSQTYNITAKGQVTLPKVLRDAVGLKPGGLAKFFMIDDHTIGIRVPMSAEALRRKVGPPDCSQPLSASEQENLRARGLS